MKKVVFAGTAVIFCAALIAAQPCVDTSKQIKPQLSEETRKDYEGFLANERTDYFINPDNANRIVWFARRTAYLGEYKAAIKIYTDGLKWNPKDAAIYRHRGHRLITIRCFDDAIKDFETAAKLVKGKPDEIELDGIPNAKNIPTSTLQSNIWYHLGLAYYLKGDFRNALRAYKECRKVSKNNDMSVATAYWQYMTLRRMGKTSDAKRVLESFSGTIEVIENTDYLKLIRLNRGEERPENMLTEIRGEADTLKSSSLGYGIGNYFLYNGDKEKALTIFRKIVEGNQWASFGYIAAEAELNRR
jgi:tetratricopeptide (TPR) repeat protein